MTDSQVEAQVENNAEGVQKLTDTKAIIAYLIEKFPLCFIAEGEAKPLKIGLFQDLAEALKDDERVSKTQLRQALSKHQMTECKACINFSHDRYLIVFNDFVCHK